MPRVKEIHLNPFQYPLQGNMGEASSVIVQEPGFSQIKVHRAMSHHVMQAMMGMQKHKGLLEADEDKPVVIDQDGNEDDNADQIMSLFAMAIEDGDKFQKVCTDIQGVMTNNAIIARISDGHNTPISEAAWNGIAETNGDRRHQQGAERVLGFFLDGAATGPITERDWSRRLTYLSLSFGGGLDRGAAECYSLREIIEIESDLSRYNREVEKASQAQALKLLFPMRLNAVNARLNHVHHRSVLIPGIVAHHAEAGDDV